MNRRTLRTTIALGLGALVVPLLGVTTAPATAAPRVGKVLASNMQVPWGIAFLPNGSALVSERDTGRIYRVGKNGGKRLVGRIDAAGSGEGGLLGLAVGPGFRRSRWVYAYFTTANDNRITRMRFNNGRFGPRRPILTGIPHAPNHDGGRLAFSPGGMLFASTGDASNPALAQNRNSLAGKILRMHPNGRVPRDNPFGNRVWSYGHRNVEGIAFDSRGRLWATEFGANTTDELNRIVKRGNYGWPMAEGSDGPGGFRDPHAQWSTADASPSGVAIVKGRAWVGALRGQSLWSVRLRGPRAGRKVRYFNGRWGRIRSVQRAPGGSLWVTTSNRDGRGSPAPADDRIFRIRP